MIVKYLFKNSHKPVSTITITAPSQPPRHQEITEEKKRDKLTVKARKPAPGRWLGLDDCCRDYPSPPRSFLFKAGFLVFLLLLN